ncbi:hypothetical protein ACNO8X_19500 [Mycobacterium sp. PDNC021]|uniref:hypothetical protein n=1 Tax=Mycobacterium sp. PDNC021 TaxID=3391399 RepID=UPI003AAEE449
MTSSDERHYRRRASDYVRPAIPLRLDGTTSWDAKTGWENVEVLEGLPLGSEFSVEVVPEPGNPHDHTALALDVDGVRVGYLPAAFSARLFPAVVEANRAGFIISASAKTRTDRSLLKLLVRFSEGADLRAWLRLPPEVRGTTFFEFDWIKPGRQFAHQDQISAAVGDADESQLFDCEFVPADDQGRLGADMYVQGNHVGQLARYEGGSRVGLARFARWPDNVAIKVLVPHADGTWPRSTQPFTWKT